MGHFHHGFHVLVGLGDFFGHRGPARAPDNDALGLQFLDDVPAPGRFQGRLPGHLPARAVAGAAESFAKGLVRAHQHKGITPHVPGDEHRLARLLVGRGRLRVARGKGPGRTLAVDAEFFLPAVYLVLFDLGDVMGHVINQLQTQIPGAHLQDLLKALPDPVGDQLPVGKGKIGRGGHGRQILLAFRRT